MAAHFARATRGMALYESNSPLTRWARHDCHWLGACCSFGVLIVLAGDAVAQDPGREGDEPVADELEPDERDAGAALVRALLDEVRAVDAVELARYAAGLVEASSPLRHCEGLAAAPAFGILGPIVEREPESPLRDALTMALFDRVTWDRTLHPDAIPLALRFLRYYQTADRDPRAVGREVAFFLSVAAERQRKDYGSLVLPLLEASNNERLLASAYDYVDPHPARNRERVVWALLEHPNPIGRFGALECFRHRLEADGHDDWLVPLLTRALVEEPRARNRVLIAEALLHFDPDLQFVDLGALVGRAMTGDEERATLEVVAAKVDHASFKASLYRPGAVTGERPAVVEVLGLHADPSDLPVLRALVLDSQCSIDVRKAALCGTWRGASSAHATAWSRIVLDDREQAPELRATSYALAVLADLPNIAPELDPRRVAREDPHDAVRELAVSLLVYDSRTGLLEWLEEYDRTASDRRAADLAVDVADRLRAWADGGAADEPLTLGGLHDHATAPTTYLDLLREQRYWREISSRLTGPAGRETQRRAARLQALLRTIETARAEPVAATIARD